MSLAPYCTSSSTNPETIKECPVCFGKADHAHFGSLQSCCNGCAAFFRRSIVEHQSYVCRRDEKCVIKREKGKRGCRFCRFQACLKAGMTVNAVLAKPNPTIVCDDFGNGSLVFLLKCRRAMFVKRGCFLVDFYGGAERYKTMTGKIKTAKSCQLALKAEHCVLHEFIRMIDIEGDPDFFKDLVDEVLPLWVHCESVFATARHRGYTSKQTYYLDDSFLHFNIDALTYYFQQYGTFKDPHLIARCSVEMFAMQLETAKRLYDNRITDVELAAIQFLFLLQTAVKLRPNSEKYKKTLNQFFNSLKKHYEENYEDVAIRLANIILSMQSLQEINWLQIQFLTLQRLEETTN